MNDRAWIEISLSALKNNLNQIQQHIGRSKVMGVVKDHFYGLGLDSILALQEMGIDYFCVSNIDEAIELRQIGIDQKILILGYTHPNRFTDLVAYDIEQTIVSFDYFELMRQYHQSLKGQIKVNTGMNRLGILYTDTKSIQQILENNDVQITGIFSHLLAADELTDQGRLLTQTQIERYQQVLTYCDERNLNYGITHLLNSYGALFYGDNQFDYVRPGIVFVGCQDVEHFENVLTLKARVAMVKEVKAGEQLGYGSVNQALRDMKVATVTIGYGDGILRHLAKTDFPFRIHNQDCHLVGRICMDQCLVDVSHLETVAQGDVVEIISKQHDIFEMAQALDTIANELLCLLNTRLPKETV